MTEVKREITTGNIYSMITTLIAILSGVIGLTLAYGHLAGADRLLEAEIARLKIDVARQEAAAASTNDKISNIQGDIRVIRNILEGRGSPIERRERAP